MGEYGNTEVSLQDQDSVRPNIGGRASLPDEVDLHGQNTGTTISAGQDDAVDMVFEFALSYERVKDLPSANDDDSRETEDYFLNVPMPSSPTGITTFAYERALRNRIRSGKLAREGDYDTRAFTPTFVHDCLMLPGSLTNVLGKGSAEQIIHRMTPALLPGFHANVHMETEQPCLIQSADPQAYTQGMLIFGEGKDGRDQIHKHYRPHAKRIKLQVEMDMAIPIASEYRKNPDERWALKRKRLWAHAWLWADVRDFDNHFRVDLEGWKLEEYLASKYTLNQAMRVEEGVGEDYEVGDTEDAENQGDVDVQNNDTAEPWVPEPEPQEVGVAKGISSIGGRVDEEGRHVPSGGIGGLSYERSDDAIGKW